MRREKCFGDGRPVPMDRETKRRITACAKAMKKRTKAGKHYGVLTAKDFDVLEVLTWRFHNARTGLCFPSYDAIAQAAGCCADTVGVSIKRLEAAGLLRWVHRLKRVRRHGVVKVVRDSNGYILIDPLGRKISFPLLPVARRSETDFSCGTLNQRFLSSAAIANVWQQHQRGAISEEFAILEDARLRGM